MDAEDWAKLAASLATNLKVTFRLNRGRYPLTAAALDAKLRDEFQFKGSFVRIGMDQILQSGEVVKPTEWARDIWQLGTDRIGFSKAKTLAPLYDTISREAALGHLARQGVASMLPAMALRPKEGDVVLDMCGAPGSKSEQVLQMIGSHGALVTNDSDPKRLQSVLRRLRNVSHPNHLVICSRGQDLAHNAGAHVFDGIICDVPCSGDGTIRKYPHLWRRWRPRHGIQLHELQLELAISAASLLKVGGRMVYSTCALNPVEDEAVVAALLKATGGALRLVKIDLGNFRTRPGMATWTIDDDTANAGLDLSDDEDNEEGNAVEKESDRKRVKSSSSLSRKSKKKARRPERVTVTPTMEPPTDSKIAATLKHCARVLSHDNDTEGFFLAVLEKVKSWDSKTAAKKSAEDSKDLLAKVGFNARVNSDVKLRRINFDEDPPSVLYQALEAQVGLSEDCDGVIRFRNLRYPNQEGDLHYAAALLSKEANTLIEKPWLRSGAVPLLRAGAEIAITQTKDSPEILFRTIPQAGTALAEALIDNTQEPIHDIAELQDKDALGMCIMPGDMLSLLQIVMGAVNANAEADQMSDEEDDDDRPSRRKKKKNASPVLVEIGQCVAVLDDEDYEEDELDMCQHPVSNRIVDSPVYANLTFAVKPFEIPDESKPSTTEDVVEEETEAPKRRMSKAERKRLKKQAKGGDKGAQSASPKKDLTKEETKLPPFDMFADTPAAPFEFVLQFRKVSPSHLEVITDYSRVMSYGLTLQHHLQHFGGDEDDEEEVDEEEGDFE
mmetsp:Transcript_4639/g.7627  ORF Transcript_4639/g.7627 Transcript_4639/m.7627 type:complete len:782 (-) Transcript_4639:91-2436(-)